jgi:outer membrane receptor protein involved in Fe transport
MRKQLFQAFLALGVLGGAHQVISPNNAWAQSGATVGSLRGVLKDKATGEPAIGATVVATSPALVGEQVVITDETGQYFINSLPPGTYTLTIYYNNQPFSRPNVLIQLGKEAVVNVTVDSSTPVGKAGPGEVIEIKGSVPIIDQGSTKTGFTITDDYTRNIPTGRTFGGVLGSAAGSQEDQFGVSLAGATSAENVYVVEGINTTDTGFGGISSNLPNEFIQETEIITGGYNAEFGRATGGIVNVVTKSGSDELRGSVFGYLTPGAFVSNAKAIQREASAIDTENNLNYAWDVGAELGGPIIPKKLWFHVGINPSQRKNTVTRSIQSQIDEDQDGVPDVDPNTGFTKHTPIGTENDLTQNLTTYFFTAKINGAIDQNHQFQVSAFGNPRSGDAVTAGQVRSRDAAEFRIEDGAFDFSGKWTSKFNDGKTQLDAVAGFHRGYENTLPRRASQDVGTVEFGFERPLTDFAALEGDLSGCQDDPMGGSDLYPLITNCPVTSYRTQGLATLEDRTNDRLSFAAAATHRVKLAGYHTFKGGIDVERATYNAKKHLTGGQFLQKLSPDDGDVPGLWFRQEFLQVVGPLDPNSMDPLANDQTACATDPVTGEPTQICQRLQNLNADTTNRSLAAFVQDSWQIRPNLTLNAGLRWEQQTGYVASAVQGTVTPQGETVPDKAYELKNLLAPRIGFIYDPTQEGKSKVFGHWGRFYENVPMDLNVRAFGGEITNIELLNVSGAARTDPGFNTNCDVDFTGDGRDLAGVLSQCDDRANLTILSENATFVAPNLKGQYTQELILGGEYEVMPDLKVGLNYIHRSLPTVIEDISTDGGNNYLITNPGGDFSSEAAELRQTAMQTLANAGCSSFDDMSEGCDAAKQSFAALQNSRADQLDAVDKFDKPVRNYDAVQLTVVQRPTKASLIQASYTYSVSKGNYPGLFSTETGQLDPNLTSLYDLPDLMANRYGNMGLDRPHNVKIDGFYMFDLKKAGLVTTGVSFRAISGIAHNALGGHPAYGEDESFILPRGAISRSPVTFQTDIHLAYGRQLNKRTKVEGFVRVFNLLNAQEELDADERYTLDNVVPIVGGDESDLAHVKTLDADGIETNSTPFINQNFRKLVTRQAPRSVQLGFRVTF